MSMERNEQDQTRDKDKSVELYQQGVTHYNQQQYNQAEEVLRQACEYDKLNPQICYALANVLIAKQQPYQAVAEYEKTIELKPDFFLPLRNLAILYQQIGFRNKAVEMWERALRHSPNEEARRTVREQLIKLL